MAFASSSLGRRTWWVWARDQVVLAVDAKAHVTMWNSGAEKLFGVAAGAAVGKRIDEALGGASAKDLAEVVDRCLDEHGPFLLRDATFRAGDVTRWFDFRCTPYPATDGDGHHVLVLGTDVTARHRDDPMLRHLDLGRVPLPPSVELPEGPPPARPKSAADPEPRGTWTFLADAVFACDARHRVVFWSSSAEHLLGLTEEQAVGKPVTAVLPFLHRKRYRAAAQRAMDGLTTRLKAGRPAGHANPLRLVLSPAGDLGAAGRGYVVVMSEQPPEGAPAEVPAGGLGERFEPLTQAANEPMLLLRADGTVVAGNPQARRLFRLRGEGPWAFRDLLPRGERLPELASVNERAPHVTHRLSLATSRGRRTVSMLAWMAEPARGGAPATLVAMFVDTTERDRREAEVLESRDLLAVYNRLLSHDITNLVAAMQLQIQLLDGDGLPPGAAKRVASVRGLTKEVEALIHNVYLLQQAPAHRRPPPLDGAQLLREAVQMASLAFPRKEVRASVDQAVWVHAEPTLAQVFYNVLSNALRHNPRPDAKAWVEVEAPRSGKGSVVWSVLDNGPGVPPEYREPKPVRDVNSRHGLGLSIAAALVRRWGGTLRIEDRVRGQPAKGTAVRIALPLAAPRAGAREGSKAAPARRTRAPPARARGRNGPRGTKR